VPEWAPAPATLRRDAAALGLDVTDRQGLQIIAFGHLLLRWNRAFNLISRQDAGRLYTRHLLDSLSIARWLPALDSPARILDLGTGAGLPGIPLAVVRPDLTFVLVDRTARKIRFVEHAVRALELQNVRAHCADVTRVKAASSFDCVVARGVAGLAQIWELAAPVLQPGGRLLLMAHGQRDHGDRPAVLDPAGASRVDIQQLAIPGLEHPHTLLIVERASAAPSDLSAARTEN
jgi:16S rRNA (guanine527-N7)-methyltransferase